MGGRLFAAIRPPVDVVERIDSLVEPYRASDPRLLWVYPQQWHITTVFMAEVSPEAQDQLVEGLSDLAARTPTFPVLLARGGCFPNPFQARLLYLGVETGNREIADLGRSCRGIANHAGARPDGSRFVPHLSIARTRNPFDATRWMHVLNGFGEITWQATEMELVQSYLGEGPRRTARYEVIEKFPFAQPRLSLIHI